MVSTSVVICLRTRTLIPRQRRPRRLSTLSVETSPAAPCLSVNSVTRPWWDLSLSMHRQCGTTRSSATSPRSKQCSAVPHGLHVGTTMRTSNVTAMLQKLQWDSLQLRRARSRVLMLYRVRYGLYHSCFSPSTASCCPHQRVWNHIQTAPVQCRTNTYSQTFFPSTICLWNTLPVDVCQLPPDSFKARICPRQVWYWRNAYWQMHTPISVCIMCAAII